MAVILDLKLGRHGSKEKEEDCDNSSCSRARKTAFMCIHDVSNCHIDPMEQEFYYDPLIDNNVDHGTVDTVAASKQWSVWRDNLATEMCNE
ncbi:hypothetical protein L3X38_010853 [Prunus dulcis]|uniref:Uncharacterized protein n=1 Tax=Prunus dulcis TaxID=3755 RepID=A0AAD4WJ23_PRUDU|nr:hypothetical protein L3X38_010853 [Prunus dulcis]